MTSSDQLMSEDLWKRDFFLRKLEGQLTGKRLLSLDIFDTLLLRTVAEPAAVFEMTARTAIRAGALSAGISPADYRLMRVQAERGARERRVREDGHDEATLENIYAELPDRLGDRERLLALELETESEVLYLNPNIASLIRWCRARGVRVALLSDMYLSSGQLTRLLAEAGLPDGWIDALLVSSEHGCGKASGGLFRRLQERYPDVPPEAVVHIGDQPRSDVQGAALAGIPALHYGVVPETFVDGYHWDRIRHGTVLSSVQSLCKLTEHTAPAEGEEPSFYYRTGVRTLGPALAAFAEWVIDVCAAEGRREVHPLMREAVLLGPLLEQIVRQRGLDLRVTPLYVSRQAMYLATLERFGERELDALLRSDCTVRELFRMLGIEAESAPFEAELALPVSACGRLTELRSHLLTDALRSRVEAAMERQRRLLAEYLRRTCADPRQLVTVDIGFHGTIQSSLERVLASAGLESRAIHLLAIGGDGLERLQNRGCDIRCHLERSVANEELARPIRRSPAFVEELMMGGFGTALGYAEEPDGRVVPVLAPLRQEAAELEAKRACQAGVLAYQAAYWALREQKPQLAERVRESREWYKPLHRAISMPTPEEAQRLGGLYHQDHYLSEFIPICQPIADAWFRGGEADFLRICNFGPSTLNINWPQGTLSLRSPYYLYEHALQTAETFGAESIWFDLIRQAEAQGFREIRLLGAGRSAEQAMKRAYLHRISIPEWVTSPERLKPVSSGGSRTCWLIATLAEEEIETWRGELEMRLPPGGLGPDSLVLYPVVGRQSAT